MRWLARALLMALLCLALPCVARAAAPVYVLYPYHRLYAWAESFSWTHITIPVGTSRRIGAPYAHYFLTDFLWEPVDNAVYRAIRQDATGIELFGDAVGQSTIRFRVPTLAQPGLENAVFHWNGQVYRQGEAIELVVEVIPRNRATKKISLSGVNKMDTDMRRIARLTAKVTAVKPSGKASLNGDLVWASDNPAVLTVDQRGIITAVAPGSATVFAWNSEGAVAHRTVTVSKALRIELSCKKATLRPGQEIALSAVVHGGSADERLFARAVKPGIVEVTALGGGRFTVRALRAGKASVILSDATGKWKAACAVTVKSAR